MKKLEVYVMLDKLKKMFDKGLIASVFKDKGTDAKAKATKEKKSYIEVLETKLDPKNSVTDSLNLIGMNTL